MKRKPIYLFALLSVSFLVIVNACKKDDDDQPTPEPSEYTITDNGSGTGTVTWKSGKVYILDGLVFVNDGQVLTIEAGTVIKGKPGQGESASALIVARGGKIMAEGTADHPIIFTSEGDDLSGSVSVTDRGLWGGLIILGKAKLNSSPGETAIEGIPTTETRGLYGGNDDTDNSGVLHYVSIRHGGTDIGEGNEINGLTLGGVGSGTVIEYVEVVANKDDGVEFFGGMPRLKHILVSYCGDDSFDYDEGYRGYGQFWCAIQDPLEGDRIGEHDGGTDPETAQPYAIPYIYNATYIGRGSGAGSRVLTLRDNAGGHYAWSIFVNQDKGVDIEMTPDNQNTYAQFKNGNLSLKNNLFSGVADGTAEGIFKVSFLAGSSVNPDSATAVQEFTAKFSEWTNLVQDPGVSAQNPVPTNASAGTTTVPDPWFEQVSWYGAFEPGVVSWAEGWTLTFEAN